MLRLPRLARVLKIAHMMLTKDISWEQGRRFQSFMLCVIGFNSPLIGLECHIPDFLYCWVEVGLLCIYIFELVVLMRVSDSALFFWNCTLELFWNWPHLVIVVGAVVEQWSMPAFRLVHVLLGSREGLHDGAFGQFFMLLPLVRLLCIICLAKFIVYIPPLYALVLGIAEAVQGMAWVKWLAVLLLYFAALLGVKFVDRGVGFTPRLGIAEVPEPIIT